MREPPVPKDIGSGLARVHDEQLVAGTVGAGHSGGHALELRVGPTVPFDRLIDLVVGPVETFENLECGAGVHADIPAPVMNNEMHQRADRQARRDTAAAGAAQAVGHDKGVSGFVKTEGRLRRGKARRERLLAARQTHDEIVVLVGCAFRPDVGTGSVLHADR